MDTFLTLSTSSLLQVTSISLRRAYTHASWLSFCGCCPRDRSPDHLALTATRTWIHKSHRTVVNKKSVLNRCRSTLHTCCGYTPGLNTEEAGKNAHFTVHPWKGLNNILSHFLSENPVSNHLGVEYDPPSWDTDHSLHAPNYRTTRNEERGLDNHTHLRHNQELRPGWLARSISYTKPFS